MSRTTSSSTQVTSAVPPEMPQVLTKSVIPTLTQDLDASDVLECYALVRSAPLHGIANSTIHIHKTAIGFRYRPPGGKAQKLLEEKNPIEMTLEYGPQRFGPMLDHEAMPYIQISEQESSFVGWENVGRVFYTHRIQTETFVSSYFMGSMTGAVLQKALLSAVEYTELRRRYQPFAVYSANNGKEVRSSSSVDFARYIWRQLANLGVEIHPILPPPIYEARLWVTSWEKVAPAPASANKAAAFYQNLYKCMEAIATNDYSEFIPTAEPTASPYPSRLPTVSPYPSIGPTINEVLNINGSHSVIDSPSENLSDFEDPSNETDFEDPRVLQETFSGQGLQKEEDLKVGNNNIDENNLASNNDDSDIGSEQSSQFPSMSLSLHPSSMPVPLSDTLVPTDGEIIPEDKVKEAKEAAANAQQAAHDAKDAANTEDDTKAADAALIAADAAQAAADATSNAATKAAMEGFLSGDGTTMTSFLNQCFTNEKYRIGEYDEEGKLHISAYLYRDGSHYYKLNLTSPYLEIAKIERELPKAVNPSDFASGVDTIDFLLAFLVLGTIFLLVIVILQQMGYQCFQYLFRCQHWFFNPRKYDYEGNTLDNTKSDFDYGENGIPLSMGGRISKISPIASSQFNMSRMTHTSTNGIDLPDLSHQGGDKGRQSEVEMRMFSGRTMPRNSSHGSSQESVSDNELDEDLAIVPERIYRDPDLVELPHLKSTSKVAVPVGSDTLALGASGHPDEVEYSFNEYS